MSQAQRALFRWAAANPKAAEKRGIKPGVAREFNAADKGGKLPEHTGDKQSERASRRYKRMKPTT